MIAGLLGVLWWSNYRLAQDWRVSYAAIAAEHDAALAVNDELANANEDLAAQLERVSQRLEASQADVADMEGRLAAVANEKAFVEDEREFLSAYAERLAEISLAYDELADMFATCVYEQNVFTQMMVDFDLYWYSGTEHLVSQQATITGTACGSAEGYLGEIRRYVDALFG